MALSVTEVASVARSPAARRFGSAPGPDASPDREFAVSVRGLVKSYGRGLPSVLNGVSFEVGEGEIVGLIGANGSGKSTLLRCLAGLHPTSGGDISVLGHRFSGKPPAATLRAIRRQLGFVFQHHSLVGRLSALSNVVQGKLGEPGGWRCWNQALAPDVCRREAIQALARVRLDTLHAVRADRLSGGQSQRVAIARALVRQPRLLIADEPAASLDPAAGEEVMEIFASVARESGATVLFTSHDMDHARRYADRIVALKGGRIVFDLPCGEIRRHELDGVFN